MVDKFTCEDCGNGFWPHANKTECFELSSKVINVTIIAWSWRLL